MGKIRLDRFVASQTVFSRSEIRKMIFKGQVAVDSVIVTIPDTKIEETAKVTLDGVPICYEKYVYVAMNKPKGVLSASEDKKCKTVIDLLDESLKKRNMFPAGRLDKDSTGLIILTDDGDFAHRITSPKKHIEKSYIVTLDREVTDEAIIGFEKGTVLADGYECKPAFCERLDSERVRVILKEGKYHQIKRMFGVYSLGVNELHRERIGKLILPKSLKQGEYITVKPEQIL